MILFNRSLIVSLIATTAMLSLSMTGASAQTLQRNDIRSIATGECLDVYRGIAKANTPVGVYPCNIKDFAQQFTLETGTVYYNDGLCVGAVKDRAVLQNCNALVNSNFTFVNKQYTEFAISTQMNLYLTTPTTRSTGFKQIGLVSEKTPFTTQVFESIRL
jgi:hypothetical protein